MATTGGVPLVDSRRIGRGFRRLDAEDRLAFLADLWSARGFETSREAGVVVAVRGEETVRVAAASGSRLGERLRGAIPRIGDSDDGGADVVVEGRNRRGLPGIGLLGGGVVPGGEGDPSDGVRRLSPGDLRELLAYGVDRETGDRLSREYLETPLVVDEPASAAVGAPATTLATAGAALLTLAVLGVVLLGAPGGVPAAVPLGGPGEATETPGASTVEAESDDGGDLWEDDAGNGSTDPDDELPPGLSRTGVEDATRLSYAHRRALPTSRTLETEFEGPPDAIGFYGIVAANTVWEAESSIRYGANATIRYPSEGGNESNRTAPRERRISVYADGDWEYVRTRTVEPGATEPAAEDDAYRAARLGTFLSPTDSPTTTRIARYLDSNETRVTVATQRTHTTYVVVATEPPDSLPDTVESYRARAVVRPDGVVTRLTVTYERSDADRPVRYEQRVTRIGSTTAEPPEWLDEARKEAEEA